MVLGLVSVQVILLVSEVARGSGVSDSINAIRVLTRYVLLGAVVWGYASEVPEFNSKVVAVLYGAGTLQVLICLVSLGADLATTTHRRMSSLFFISGTFGRYDRLGLFMMAVVILLLANLKRQRVHARLLLLTASLFILYLTTSRQAMLGVAVAAVSAALMPGRPPLLRVASLVILGVVALMVTSTPTVMPANLPADPVDQTAATTSSQSRVSTTQKESLTHKGSLALSLDCNRNERLWANIVLAPWAIAQRPVLGFGPRAQDALNPDPELSSFVTRCGSSWSWMRQFMDDSNYAKLAIQFGAVFPALYLSLLLALTIHAWRTAIVAAGTFPSFAALFASAILVVAAFAPAFEIRATSAILWVSLFAVFAISFKSKGGDMAHRGGVKLLAPDPPS